MPSTDLEWWSRPTIQLELFTNPFAPFIQE